MKRVNRLVVGAEYLVSTVYAGSPMSEAGSAYPFGDKSRKIPVVVEEEHEHFYTCRVLPHHAKYCCYGVSKPYRVTVGKWELIAERFKAYEIEDDVEQDTR